ncbi:MAG: alpha/beta fold hydrolase [Hoeflea sp.]|uniref:alpha/beta fold hydrolase n=1 Tax=Hoeflea sp. TaxID=1940281 RepID=UPI001E154035|nr:alpha/beta fold hydrolase [Hoeflea sp.]MBU4528281.1 alpha/beta fold hydrolase [Alphaproteobacteria bacterium]MBU4543877.1 alpha/beta fold hydrolase [Alphaproteobacteria bacterium]MBU4548518.1 alpha/beta fold hydrolase [Alphaproteobacteria bacterium]MBV1722597.1 alpha/beta fold hydrolase [Hoeflea sp.]MBV1762266.1 alpha/beta fold hydrolase [Hoeflea sp.]
MNTVRDPAPLTQAIEAIYSYFKGDQEFTEFMKDLEDFLAVGETGQPVFTGEIGRHFHIAAELAQVMSPAPEAKYRALVEGPALKVVIDRAFRIVAQSQEARKIFGYIDGFAVTLDRHNKTVISTGTTTYSPAQIERLQSSLTSAVLANVAALFSQEGQGELINRSFVRTEHENGFVSLLRDDLLDVVVVTFPVASQNRAIPAILSESLGLSPSEVEVLELMAKGRSNVEISRERFRSVDTVKSQTQAIFRKLGVTSRLEAVQVVNDLVSLAALSGGPGELIAANVPEAHGFPFAHDPSVWRRTERGGRRISYVHYPAAASITASRRTVLMFHGLLQSPELTLGLRQDLARSGFELIGASKPGYGGTDKQPPDTSVMQTSIEDARAVCDLSGADRVIVLGHLFGAHAAMEFCLTYPERVSGLVLCSAYFPLQLADHLVPVGVLQKLAMSSGIASAAAHQFIALTAVAYLRYGGSHRYLSALAEHSAADSEAIRDKEIYGILRAGIRHVTGGGASAFLSDTSSSNSDWSGLLSRLDLPVTVLHGESDPAVNPRLARLAATRIANSRHQEVQGIGQHLLHAAPDKIIAALSEMAAATAS